MILQTVPLTRVAAPEVVWASVIYFVVVAAIAVWAARRTRTERDFFVAGGRIGIVTLAIAAMTATLSGFTFIGGPGLMYRLGLGALFIVLPASLTNSMAAWTLARRLRLLGEARGLLTIPAAIGARYRSPRAQGLAATAILIATVGYVATNFLALGIVVDAVFGTGRAVGIWIGAATLLVYSASGGILAGVYTDLFQGSVKALASVLVFAYVLSIGGGLGGISRTILAADPGFLSPWGTLTPLAALTFFFVFCVGAMGQPHVISKFYMLRDPVQLRWYPLISTVALLLTLLLYFGIGIAVKAQVASGAMPPLARPDDATPVFLLRFTPPLLSGIVFAGVTAAIMGTVNALLNVGAAALTHDLPVAMGRVPVRQLTRGRWATVALTLGAALVAQLSGSLVAFLGIFGWGLFASTLVPSLAIGLNWAGATRAAAIASILTGLGITLVFETAAYFKAFSFPAGVSVSGVSLVSSILVFLAVSAVRPGRPEELDADVRQVMEA